MRKSALALLAAAACLAACTESTFPAPLEQQIQAVGEPAGGFPSRQEREIFVLTNQVRNSPSNQCGDWTNDYGFNPKPPLAWAPAGAHGARFTAKHLHDGSCFQHASCCRLEKKSDGSVGCAGGWLPPCGGACLGSEDAECGGGTPTADRYRLFDFEKFSGENLVAGMPLATTAICEWLNSPGHRQNIYSDHNELGTGYFEGPGCFEHYWVQGFGRGAEEIPRIPGGAAIRLSENPQTAEQFYFSVNYFESTTGQAPLRATVVVDGVCLDLDRLWGEEWNGTYEHFPVADDIPPGCRRFYFLFVDRDAERFTYPTEGTLGIGIGDPSCADYLAGPQPAADCEGGPRECEEGEEESCYGGAPGTDGVGICHGGVRVCKNGFWSQCRRQVMPRDEVCNGLDDDCDGQVDEKVAGLGHDCNAPSHIAMGICRAGKNECIGGRMLCIPKVQAETETCDNRDEDCDGVIDDGLGWTTCGMGACRRLVQNCIAGTEYACTPGEPAEELCTPQGSIAVDDNCDGVYDEGCPCTDGAVRPCYSGPVEELIGTCRAGVMRCVDGAWGACVGEVAPSPEVCDGEDNDCDGSVDEAKDIGAQVCGTGRCRATTPVCSRGKTLACQPGEPSVEICNGEDDDCDGDIDEGCNCTEGASYSCYDGPPLAAGVGLCVEGARSCIDGNFSESCDGQILPTEEICGDGLDQNCDGKVDEGCPDGGDGGDGGSDGDSEGGDAGGCGCSGGGTGAESLALACIGALFLFGRRSAWRTRVECRRPPEN